jgi:hypothetical protein
MTEYWLMDAKGLVLGPVSLTVVRDLASNGRVGPRTRASTDGQTFRPLAEVQELAEVLVQTPAPERNGQEMERAVAVLRDLERFRTLTPTELFGVAKSASLREYRQGFLELAKRYHPARLPKDCHPDLLKACMGAFSYLTEQMKAVEAQAPSAVAAPRRAVVTERVATPPPAPRQQLKVDAKPGQGADWVVTVHVPPDDLSAFTAHKIANFNSKCIFVPLLEQLRLGSRVQVIIRFNGSPEEICAEGKVIFENANANARDPAGMGIRLERLSAPDQALIQQRVTAAAQAAKKDAAAPHNAR